jgi:signal transduction histidine kinase
MWRLFCRYAFLPLASVVLAFGAQTLLEPILSPSVFLPFLVAVVVSAMYGGMVGGSVAILGSALLVDYFYLGAMHGLQIDSPRDWARLCVFLSAAALVNFLTWERIARLRAETQRKTTQDLLYEVAHELRTPMTSIVGWIDILHGSSDAKEIQHALEVIERNLKLQNMLVEDLLCAAHLTQSKLVLRETQVDLRDCVDGAIDTVRPIAVKKGVDLRWQKPFDTDALLIKGDRGRLVQVFWNLLTNAIKYSRQEGIVNVTLMQDGDNAKVSVADDGIGIRTEQLKKIFEKWDRGSAKENFDGLGLGLWVAYSITESHRGRIEVSSNEGEGARFTVRLPLAVPRSST